MDRFAPRRGRLLIALVAAVAAVALAATPAQADPSTKTYSASVSLSSSDSARTSQLVVTSVPGRVSAVLWLRNDPASNQTFGSAKIEFTGDVAASSLGLPSGWSAAAGASGSSWVLTSSSPDVNIAPGRELEVDLTLTGSGNTSVTTSVKQSNDFKGNNNSFTNSGADPELAVIPSGYTICTGTCSPSASDPTTAVKASGTLSSSGQFGYQFSFEGDGGALNPACTAAAFGSYPDVRPLVVAAYGFSGVTKTISITFPRELVNYEPNNGTPWLDVCAGSDTPFPTYASFTGTAAYPYQGLLYNCDDPAYVKAVGKDSKNLQLHMCVADRSKNAGNETVVINVDSSTADPSYW